MDRAFLHSAAGSSRRDVPLLERLGLAAEAERVRDPIHARRLKLVVGQKRVHARRLLRSSAMLTSEMNTLLGHLAQFGAFSKQSELLCTQGLVYLLQKQPDALTAKVKELAGLDMGRPLTWLAEAKQADGGRPDLEARAADGGAILKIEAKLGAAMDPAQFESYVRALDGPRDRTALLVLVPRAREDDARSLLGAPFRSAGQDRWCAEDHRSVTIVLISWEAMFDTLRGSCGTELLPEIAQLEDMYRVLSGGYIEPLASADVLRQWRQRATDFENLVDQVTGRLSMHDDRTPVQHEAVRSASTSDEQSIYRHRYLAAEPRERGTCFSVGTRDPFAGYETPIWLRFHQGTPGFREVHGRFLGSAAESAVQRVEPAPVPVESEGHLWFPLSVRREINWPSCADPSPLFVARRSHTPGMLAPRALRAGRLDAGRRSVYFASDTNTTHEDRG